MAWLQACEVGNVPQRPALPHSAVATDTYYQTYVVSDSTYRLHSGAKGSKAITKSPDGFARQHYY
eukprot:13342397-Alexandrium_andersonii.AAC.1